MGEHDQVLDRAGYWLANWEPRIYGDDIDYDLVADLAAALRSVQAERDEARAITSCSLCQARFDVPAADPDSVETQPVKLECAFCGHWEVGQRTKSQVAEWLRVHRNARLGVHDGGPDRASTCPHPCGTPFVPAADPDSGDTP